MTEPTKTPQKDRYKNIRLKPRDIDLMRWMNDVGFVTLGHIMAYLGIAKTTAFTRCRKLVLHGYLQTHRVFHQQAGVYSVTRQGCQACDSTLPPLHDINLSTYYHDLQVTSLLLALKSHYQCAIEPERFIRHRFSQQGAGWKGHIPDGVLLLPEEGRIKRVAIELELSAKSKQRRTKIFDFYVKSFDYDAVWYFCPTPAALKSLSPYLSRASHFKGVVLTDWVKTHPMLSSPIDDSGQFPLREQESPHG